MMKNNIFTYLLLLANTVAIPTTVFAQNTFDYTKGKSFQEIPSLKMTNTIDLSQLSTPVFYENAIPVNQTTLSYRVQLPNHIRGLFFSRDFRPGDHQWPNNTNRLLPWTFNKLKDIVQTDYPGIPSNGGPSLLGDALLLELTDGRYLFTKVLAGENSISWFRINNDGTLTLFVSTLGKDALSNHTPLLLSMTDTSVYGVVQNAYRSLMVDKNISTTAPREDKKYFDAFNYLGWCTWEHYHFDIDEQKIISDMDVIEKSGIPIRYVLIDDGTIQSDKKERLSSMQPLSNSFPNGFARIIARKNKDKIKWMGLWHSLSGYWQGISPDNTLPTAMQHTLYKHNESMLPGPSTAHIQQFYRHYVQTLKNYGFDFIKVDNQSFTLPLYMGGTQVIHQAKACNQALEEQTHRQKVGLMNCMAQNILNTDHTRYSSVARVSIDYKKYNKDMAKSHLFQSYANTLLQGQSIWPDHDMFHSSDSICGSLMARSKAISGGPVYLSDAPEMFAKENILPLIDTDGKLFRPVAPAVPTPESILINPLMDGKAYRVFAPTGDEAVALICYNLNTSNAHSTVSATIHKADYLLREGTEKSIHPKEDRVLLFDWQQQTAEELKTEKQIELNGFTDRLFHLCPIRNGWAVVGLQDKYLSPATVEILARSNDRLTLRVLSPGILRVWVETLDKQELRSIQIQTPQKITIYK